MVLKCDYHTFKDEATVCSPPYNIVLNKDCAFLDKAINSNDRELIFGISSLYKDCDYGIL